MLSSRRRALQGAWRGTGSRKDRGTWRPTSRHMMSLEPTARSQLFLNQLQADRSLVFSNKTSCRGAWAKESGHDTPGSSEGLSRLRRAPTYDRRSKRVKHDVSTSFHWLR